MAYLQPIFQRAGLNLPQEIAPADLAAQFKAADDSAKRDLNDSYGILKDILDTDVVQNNNWAQANEARELAVTVEYALHRLEPDKGHLDSARSTVKLLSDAGANFPALPPERLRRREVVVGLVVVGELVIDGSGLAPDDVRLIDRLVQTFAVFLTVKATDPYEQVFILFADPAANDRHALGSLEWDHICSLPACGRVYAS